MPDMCYYVCKSVHFILNDVLGIPNSCAKCCADECAVTKQVTEECKSKECHEGSCKIACSIGHGLQTVIINYTRYLLITTILIGLHYYLHN